MVEIEKIRRLSERIAQEFQPERIILFGSYAYGRPTTDSDVDILVVMPFKGQPVRKALEIINRVDPRFPVDLLVRTPEQIRRRIADNDFFMREIFERGHVLYEADHA